MWVTHAREEDVLYLEKGRRGYDNVNPSPSGADLCIAASLAVPTGPENSPRTMSIVYWRHVA